MTKPGALPRPETGTEPSCNQLQASVKRQTIFQQVIHKKSFGNIQRFGVWCVYHHVNSL
jgi:hypothetical protein